MKIVIGCMSHEKYDLVVEHLRKYPKMRLGDQYKAFPMSVDKVMEVVTGNPPVYRGVEIDVKESERKEECKRVSEAVKGLVDILLLNKE